MGAGSRISAKGASELARAAYDLFNMGFDVFPLIPGDKRPAIDGWREAAQSHDAEAVEAAWAERPECNIGIAMGKGLFALDFDTHDADGLMTLMDWERAHGELPETCQSVTPTGGMHYIYRTNGTVRNSANSDIGVDVRGEGGYIVAPPSIHPGTGTAYEWEVPPDELAPAEATDAVMGLVSFAAARPGGSGEGRRFELPDRIGRGGRNDAMFSYACSLWAKGASAAEVEDACMLANAERFDPPLPEREVRQCVRSAVERYEPGPSRTKGRIVPALGDETEKIVAEPPQTAIGDDAQEPPQEREDEWLAPSQHAAIGRRLVDRRGACVVSGALAVRTDGGWSTDERDITHEIIGACPAIKSSQRREVVAWLRSEAPRVAQAHPRFIAFSNGVLDSETMRFGERWGGAPILNTVPHRWNPEAKAPDTEAMMRRVSCGDHYTYMNLWEAAGLCLYRSARYPVVPILIGSGSNGKSTYIDMLRAMVGQRNASFLDIHDLSGQFLKGQLAGKLANFGDDIPKTFTDGRIWSVIKKISAGNTLFADVKGAEGFSFRPYCTLVFSANEMPRMEDSSFGTMRRLAPIPFEAVFSRDDPDFDPHILEKVMSRESMEWCLVQAVAGLSRVIMNNGLTPNPRVDAMRASIKADNDTVLQWIEDEGLAPAAFEGLTVAEAYGQYEAWCRDSGIRKVKTKKSLASTLASSLGLKSVPRHRNGLSVRVLTAGE